MKEYVGLKILYKKVHIRNSSNYSILQEIISNKKTFTKFAKVVVFQFFLKNRCFYKNFLYKVIYSCENSLQKVSFG